MNGVPSLIAGLQLGFQLNGGSYETLASLREKLLLQTGAITINARLELTDQSRYALNNNKMTAVSSTNLSNSAAQSAYVDFENALMSMELDLATSTHLALV